MNFIIFAVGFYLYSEQFVSPETHFLGNASFPLSPFDFYQVVAHTGAANKSGRNLLTSNWNVAYSTDLRNGRPPPAISPNLLLQP